MVLHRAKALLKQSESFILDCGGGVRLQGHYSGRKDHDRDLVVLIHGWEGSADSLYLLSSAAYLHQQGFAIFRLNLRDHGPTHHLNRKLFHACRIDEVTGAVGRIHDLFPRKRLCLGGFSLGGNFALRVALRAPGAGIPLDRVVAVCPVLSPKRTMRVLEEGWVAYHYYFMKKWRRSMRKKRECFPELRGVWNLSRFNTLGEMTDYFVHHHTAFGNVETYLNGYAITGDVLENLKVPSLIIASADDPVIPSEDLANLAAPDPLQVQITQYGGHCGFIEDYRFRSWADRRMARFFTDGQKSPVSLSVRHRPGQDGQLREAGVLNTLKTGPQG